METTKPLIESLVKEANRIEEDAEHSARGHFEAARRWTWIHYLLGIPSVILSVCAGFFAGQHLTSLSITSSLVVALLTALMTLFKPNEHSNSHHVAGTKFLALRNEARIFAEVTCATGTHTPNDLENTLGTLNALRSDLNCSSPQIPRFAYLLGKKRIQAGEAEYKADVQ